jgi:hypothetical protein
MASVHLHHRILKVNVRVLFIIELRIKIAIVLPGQTPLISS